MLLHYVLHQFRPSETVDAVLRLRGRHNYTPEEILTFREKFNELNGLRVPRVGDVYKIPVEELVVDNFGQLLNVAQAAAVVDAPVVTDPGDDREEPPQGQHPSHPSEPVHELPPQPETGAAPQNATKKHGNQEVTPDSGKDAHQHVDAQLVQPTQGATLLIGGSRRRRAPR